MWQRLVCFNTRPVHSTLRLCLQLKRTHLQMQRRYMQSITVRLQHSHFQRMPLPLPDRLMRRRQPIVQHRKRMHNCYAIQMRIQRSLHGQ